MLRPEDAALDVALAARGYTLVDPVLAYAAPVTAFAAPPPMAGFAHWPPLQIAADLWAEGGIGPARLAVMHRARAPKTAILARARDRAVGVAFVALHQGIAMLHALEVARPHRRQGSAQNLVAAAAHWAADHGAATLALVVTEANLPARRLYQRLGMHPLAAYHYRQQ
jgi:GNAT superfamily N-acetyltransferase